VGRQRFTVQVNIRQGANTVATIPAAVETAKAAPASTGYSTKTDRRRLQVRNLVFFAGKKISLNLDQQALQPRRKPLQTRATSRFLQHGARTSLPRRWLPDVLVLLRREDVFFCILAPLLSRRQAMSFRFLFVPAILLWGLLFRPLGKQQEKANHTLWCTAGHNCPMVRAGQVSGVAVDSHNHVFVFHRAENSWATDKTHAIASPTVLCFDGATGKLLFSWDKTVSLNLTVFAWTRGQCLAHRSRAPAGLQVFSRRQAPARYRHGEDAGVDATHFNLPADIAFASDGSVYVADGYGNNRIAKFSPTASFFSTGDEKARCRRIRPAAQRRV
jgi:DNA-binding beta-propeller fold protein YncE